MHQIKFLEDFMKNVTKLILGLLICSFVSCGTSGTSYGRLTDSMNLTAGSGESEIIVKRPFAYTWSVPKQIIIIDGQPQLTLKNGSSGKIIVKNGTHTIYVEWGGLKTSLVEFTAESNRITFLSYFKNIWRGVFVIEKESEFALSPTSK